MRIDSIGLSQDRAFIISNPTIDGHNPANGRSDPNVQELAWETKRGYQGEVEAVGTYPYLEVTQLVIGVNVKEFKL